MQKNPPALSPVEQEIKVFFGELMRDIYPDARFISAELYNSSPWDLKRPEPKPNVVYAEMPYDSIEKYLTTSDLQSAASEKKENEIKSFLPAFFPQGKVVSDKGLDSLLRLNYNSATANHTIYQFSLPFFSADKKSALLYVSWICGNLCGGGHATLLTRDTSGKWRMVVSWGNYIS